MSVDFPSGGTFPLGRTVVTVTATDAAKNSAAAFFFVDVVDTTAPAIERFVASPDVVWPPNHKMRSVEVAVQVAETVDPAPVTRIVSVVGNEPEAGAFEGDVGPDTVVARDLSLEVRAQRLGAGSGRVYTVTVESRDSFGNASRAAVEVKVPKSQGHR